MGFDKQALKWTVRSLLIALVPSIAFYLVPYLYPFTQRLCYTLMGVASTVCILFCEALYWVKKMPVNFRKKHQGYLDNGHASIGLLSTWFMLLHSNFKVPLNINFTMILYYYYFMIIISGLLCYHFLNLQVMLKDAKGSVKKETAGTVIKETYNICRFIHEELRYGIYVLLFMHVLAYMYFGSLW